MMHELSGARCRLQSCILVEICVIGGYKKELNK
jgi:hypothetical protein